MLHAAAAEQENTPLNLLDLRAISSEFSNDAREVFDLEAALRARTNPGAPSIENVRREIERWKTQLA